MFQRCQENFHRKVILSDLMKKPRGDVAAPEGRGGILRAEVDTEGIDDARRGCSASRTGDPTWMINSGDERGKVVDPLNLNGGALRCLRARFRSSVF